MSDNKKLLIQAFQAAKAANPHDPNVLIIIGTYYQLARPRLYSATPCTHVWGG
jgi:hypothetical protein